MVLNADGLQVGVHVRKNGSSQTCAHNDICLTAHVCTDSKKPVQFVKVWHFPSWNAFPGRMGLGLGSSKEMLVVVSSSSNTTRSSECTASFPDRASFADHHLHPHPPPPPPRCDRQMLRGRRLDMVHVLHTLGRLRPSPTAGIMSNRSLGCLAALCHCERVLQKWPPASRAHNHSLTRRSWHLRETVIDIVDVSRPFKIMSDRRTL